VTPTPFLAARTTDPGRPSGRRVLAVLALTAAAGVALAGCSGSPAAGGTGSPAAATAGATAASAASATAAASAAAATAAADGSGGSGGTWPVARCSMLTKSQAGELLGSTVTKTLAGPATSEAGMRKIDGCYYRAGTSSLGYDVLELTGATLDHALSAVRGAPRRPGMETFDPGLGTASIGVVIKLPKGTSVIVHAGDGNRLVSSSVSMPSAAAARTAAVAAVRSLLRG
jgi:hypothetical protein